MAESEGFRRAEMVDDEEDEEHRRYLAVKAAEEAARAPAQPGTAPPMVVGLPVVAGLPSATGARPVLTRDILEREHASRQAALVSAASAAHRHDGYFTQPTGAAASASTADGWAQLEEGGKAQAARETREFLSQWGDVLR